MNAPWNCGSVLEGWSIVVAQDYNGAPVDQLVTPDKLLPLEDEELTQQ